MESLNIAMYPKYESILSTKLLIIMPGMELVSRDNHNAPVADVAVAYVMSLQSTSYIKYYIIVGQHPYC